MSIATDLTRLQTAKADLKTAIEGKGVTVPSATKIDGYADLVESIETGGGGTVEPEEKDVDFIDYDGTLLYSYTAAEFLAMTEMPPNPSHTGLVAQGWNWTLADAKEIVEDCGFHVIGQNYTTDDGTTRIYITINERDGMGAMYLRCYAINGSCTITIDWGDGTSETVTSSAQFAKYHSYASVGNYVIRIAVTNGEMLLGHWGANAGCVWPNDANANDAIKRVTKIEIGNGVAGLGSQPFMNLSNLTTVSIPVTCIDASADPAFTSDTASIKGIVLPNGTTALGNQSRNNAASRISLPKTITSISTGQYYRSVKKLVIPDGVTSAVAYTFREMYSISRLRLSSGVTSYPDNFTQTMGVALEEITIPSGVTSIGANFMNNSRLSKIHLKPTTPPTLSNVNAFPNLGSTAKFYVPYSADHSILAAYQSATNWSSFASKMVEESA